jgi:hypothetical protein
LEKIIPAGIPGSQIIGGGGGSMSNQDPTKTPLREAIAGVCHEQWIEITRALVDRGIVPADLAMCWRKAWIPYMNLTTEQKRVAHYWSNRIIVELVGRGLV